jgi:hypothetical protein
MLCIDCLYLKEYGACDSSGVAALKDQLTGHLMGFGE